MFSYQTILISSVALVLLMSSASRVIAADDTTYSSSTITPQESPAGNQSAEPAGSLSLTQALASALLKSPELSAYSTEIRAQEAAALQAGLLPNPVFGANAANFGNQVIKSYDGDVVTLQLSQLIELGGKRAARISAADLSKQLAAWDYEAKRADVLTQVSQAFIEVLTTQQRLVLIEQMQTLAQQTFSSTSARVQAGKVSPVEENKAKIALASAQIELQRTQRQLNAAKKQLAAFWGSTAPRFDTVAGSLETLQPPPGLETLLQRLADNPDLARWTTEITQRQALIEVEESKVIPDLTATVGASKYLMPQDYALTVGFSMPLPVFDRNQGRIGEAQQRLAKAEDERRNAEVRIRTALNTAYQRLDAAYAEVNALHQDILPNAESAYQAASEGYRLGKFGFLDVLDAQRTLFSTQSQHLSAEAEYHKALADVERLIGGNLHSQTEAAQ